ncbi:MAG: gliding motility lipoprotein GldH [Bacteroidales bacterium]|nr:gliding motility lipoprotein GldH [Bacteroidales bacterium]
MKGFRQAFLASFLLASGLLFFSCTASCDYEEHVSFQGEAWDIGDEPVFVFEIKDTSTPYALGLNFRYTDTFPYQDIYLFLQTTFPDGSGSQDTLHCFLFEADGKPLGKGRRVKELDVPYSLLRFPMPGKYTLRYTQGLRTDRLKGVASFGMSLKKTETDKQAFAHGKQKNG